MKKVNVPAPGQAQQGKTVIAAVLRKQTERFDRDGRLVEATDSQEAGSVLEAAKRARAAKLGMK